MSSLPSPELLPILKRLNAAVGYLNLGMLQEVWNELEDIEPKEQAEPIAGMVRYLAEASSVRRLKVNGIKRGFIDPQRTACRIDSPCQQPE